METEQDLNCSSPLIKYLLTFMEEPGGHIVLGPLFCLSPHEKKPLLA